MSVSLPEPLAIWLVEDDGQFQDDFAAVVNEASDLTLTATFGTVAGFEHALDDPTRDRPDLVVMDVRLPDGNGITATRRYREDYRGGAVLMLTSVDAPDTVFAALQAGAVGYILKDRLADSLLKAARQAVQGGMDVSPGVAAYVLDYFQKLPKVPAQKSPPPKVPSPLSAREEEVIRLMARGFSQKRIADALCISTHTVDTHVRNIYRKLHASTGLEAVAIAVRMGIAD
ncbi:MAG: response regulator transcription factor [Bacteroidota bacterium]